jgi:predicted peptidase
MTLFLLTLFALQSGASPGTVQSLTLSVHDVGTITYGLSLPRGYRGDDPRPLVLALHPGGGRMPYYGADFMRHIVLPALAGLRAIVVAPDCPTRAWSDPASDKGVMELLRKVSADYAIDRRRVLVTGFSMGGRGAWFMASRHPDVFTAAIPMAASIGSEPSDRLGLSPTYIIHSRDDEVVPFGPAERNARELEKLGRAVRFEALRGIEHHEVGGYVEALERGGRWIAERWGK